MALRWTIQRLQEQTNPYVLWQCPWLQETQQNEMDTHVIQLQSLEHLGMHSRSTFSLVWCSLLLLVTHTVSVWPLQSYSKCHQQMEFWTPGNMDPLQYLGKSWVLCDVPWVQGTDFSFYPKNWRLSPQPPFPQGDLWTYQKKKKKKSWDSGHKRGPQTIPRWPLSAMQIKSKLKELRRFASYPD